MPSKTKTRNNLSQSQSTEKKIRSYRKPIDKNNILPAYKIRYDNSFSAVSMILKKGQTVFCNSGCMAWMDGKMNTDSTNRSGFFSGIKRMMLTGNSFFTTNYTGVSDTGEKITFAPKMPGDMVVLKIKPGTGMYVSNDGFTVATNNVKTGVKTRVRNLFVDENVFMTKLSVDITSPSDGYVWVSAYGGIIKKVIPKGESLKVDNGHFLACDENVNYTLGKVGTWKTAILSGEGVVMTFTAIDKPITLYLQTRNLTQLVNLFSRFFEPKKA